MEYSPPSQFLLPVLERDGGETSVDAVGRAACQYADSEAEWQVRAREWRLCPVSGTPRALPVALSPLVPVPRLTQTFHVGHTCSRPSVSHSFHTAVFFSLQNKFLDYEKRKVRIAGLVQLTLPTHQHPSGCSSQAETPRLSWRPFGKGEIRRRGGVKVPPP